MKQQIPADEAINHLSDYRSAIAHLADEGKWWSLGVQIRNVHRDAQQAMGVLEAVGPFCNEPTKARLAEWREGFRDYLAGD